MMNTDITLRKFLTAFVGRIKDAGGFVEVYYAFSSLADKSGWVEYCHQNMLEIYEGSKSLLEEMRNGSPSEELWPLLNDLSFHSALFTCYCFMFESVLSEMLLEKGCYLTDVPEQIADACSADSLEGILNNTVQTFQDLLSAFDKGDVLNQRTYLSHLSLAAAQVQCIAAKSKLRT